MSSRPSTTESAHRRFLSERYFSAFDGLRCIAICGVIWHHSLPGPVPGWLGRGHVGVPLFFALSGFLITTLLLGERRRTGDISLSSFWLRRSLRIFPLYYAALAGFALYLAALPESAASRHFWVSLPHYISYTSNWFVDFDVAHPVWFGFAWSLATEEQFYLWWPPVLRWCLRSGAWAAASVAFAAVALDQLAECRLPQLGLEVGGLSERMVTSLASPMLLGAALALLLADRRVFPALARLLGNGASLPVCAFVCALLLIDPLWPPLLLDFALASVVAASALAPAETPLARALAWGPVAHIGRVSYCMYLVHVPVLGVLKHLVPWLARHPGALFPLVLALSVAIGTLSARYVEAPFTRLRARFRHGEQSTTARAETETSARALLGSP